MFCKNVKRILKLFLAKTSEGSIFLNYQHPEKQKISLTGLTTQSAWQAKQKVINRCAMENFRFSP
jgi:hypothetical protein